MLPIVDSLKNICQTNSLKWIEPLHTRPNIHESSNVYEWWNGNRKITIYITGKGESDYVKIWGSNIHTEMDDGSITTIEELETLWRWLLSE